jgi:hypothetical protein
LVRKIYHNHVFFNRTYPRLDLLWFHYLPDY